MSIRRTWKPANVPGSVPVPIAGMRCAVFSVPSKHVPFSGTSPCFGTAWPSAHNGPLKTAGFATALGTADLAWTNLKIVALMASNLIAISVPISPSAVQDSSFTAVVARFTDADHNTNLALYSAMISWGDGQSSPGMIATDPKGGFDVLGTHTFTQAGPFRVTTQIGDTDGDSASVSTTNIVAPALIMASGTTVSATRGVPLSHVVVATFTDPDLSLHAASFSATIHWGDGRTSTGKVITNNANGGFEVIGSHVYRALGTYSIQTMIHRVAVINRPRSSRSRTSSRMAPSPPITSTLTL